VHLLFILFAVPIAARSCPLLYFILPKVADIRQFWLDAKWFLLSEHSGAGVGHTTGLAAGGSISEGWTQTNPL